MYATYSYLTFPLLTLLPIIGFNHINLKTQIQKYINTYVNIILRSGGVVSKVSKRSSVKENDSVLYITI